MSDRGAAFDLDVVQEAIRILVSPEGVPEVTGRKQQKMILLLGDDPQYR